MSCLSSKISKESASVLVDNQDRFFTVHVRPEKEFSYASFEAIFYQTISRTRSDEFGSETDSKTMKCIETMICKRYFSFKSRRRVCRRLVKQRVCLVDKNAKLFFGRKKR